MMPMKYYKDLYLDEVLNDDEPDKLKAGIPSHSVYALCLCPSSSDLFEIMTTAELLKDFNRRHDYSVIALVASKDKAKDFTVKMIKLWLRDNDSMAGIKEYYYNNSL